MSSSNTADLHSNLYLCHSPIAMLILVERLMPLAVGLFWFRRKKDKANLPRLLSERMIHVSES